MGSIPPDAGYEEVSFPAIYQKDYTISVSSNHQPISTNSSSSEALKVKTAKKPSGILKTPTNYPVNHQSIGNETETFSSLAGYIPGDTWQSQKNVQWDASDDKQNWDSKIDETKVIKEFSYQYIKPEQIEKIKTEADDPSDTPETNNLVQSRIRSFETTMDDASSPVREFAAMQEPLKVSPSQATEAHVSKLDSTRKTTPKACEFVPSDPTDDPEMLSDVRSREETDPYAKQITDSGKSVKDLLADFERKSQMVRRQEDDRMEQVKHRGVFSDTETLLYDTGSDLDQPDKSDGEDLYQTITKRCEYKDDHTDTIKKNQDITGDKRKRRKISKVIQESCAGLVDLDVTTDSQAFARLSMTESMVTHGDELSGDGTTPSPQPNLDDMNPEDHYLPMSPRKAILDPNNDDRSNPKMMETLFMNLRAEESSYVEMAQNGMGRSLLAPNDSEKLDSGDYSTLDTPHYEFVCVADNKVEPVYMEVSQLAEKDDQKESGGSGKQKDAHGNNGQLQVRGELPDILTALKSDSSDADDESSKDLDSIDAPRHPRFSLSDTFRPASYYLGASPAMIAELHDSSDSELVSPPPIPTSPPPLEELDSMDLQESLDGKKVSPQIATARDSSSTRSSPKSWNKATGQVDNHGSPSRFSEATMSSTFRDSRVSLESVSGDSLELRNPEEEARHRQLKRRPVSDEVCEVLDSLDELESLGSRFDGASIDLDQYLEKLQARDAFNVDLYAKDLSYNSIYGFNENMMVTDKLKKPLSQELVGKMNMTSNDSLDQPFQYGCRAKTSSASSLPSMRVSDTPPSHQHSQSFTGDGHYENVASFTPMRGSPAARRENEQMHENCRFSRHGGQISAHSRDSSYSLVPGTSNSTSGSYHRPNSAMSMSIASPVSPYVHQHYPNPELNRHHARSASHDTPRDAMSPHHRTSSSQDSTFYIEPPMAHQGQRISPVVSHSTGMPHQHRHQHQPNDTDQAGAPYYYSDLQVSVSSVDAQLNRFAIGHTSRLPQLNNQRDDSNLNKRNDIGRLVNPITRQMPRRIEVEDIDQARRIAAELRKSSTQYLVEAKTGLVDRKNFYEADTLRRAKSTDPLPNEMSPDVSTVNIYPMGLRDKSNSQTNLTLDEIVPELEQITQPSHRRSRSLEGLLDDVGLQHLVEQRNRANRVSSVPPTRTQEYDPTDTATGVSSFTPINAEHRNDFSGEDPWEQDSLWRESLRRVSLRQARSLDNLDNSNRSMETIPQELRTRPKITRGATYVNDSVVLQRQQLRASPEDRVSRRSAERNPVESERMDDVPDEEEGTYESLAMNHRLTGDYIWDPENEAYRRQSTNVQNSRNSGAVINKNFLSDGNLPPVVSVGSNNRTSTSTSGSFELDREKLRQWDLVSSACLLQEQQRNSMADSGRGLPVSEDQRPQGRADVGDKQTRMTMMMATNNMAENRIRNDADGAAYVGNEGKLGNHVNAGRQGRPKLTNDVDDGEIAAEVGSDGCNNRATGEWLFRTGAGLYKK